ncbi:hypothetical protein F511_17348 [Dorcoceras hygrometricum]|uniref:Uncharacterized protein n=1 Tax=Dorcoceras hygrometricum TaxID=472368 RepID=A0A2Z7DFD4_9LAMI|nr:hypothetical protein F511_17348 [Dorcoceras hygrometricum]
MHIISKLGLRDEGIDQLNFHSAQLGYLKLLQMGTQTQQDKAGNKYEVKPQYEELSKQLGGRHSNPVVTTPTIALDFSDTAQQSASHNVAPNQVSIYCLKKEMKIQYRLLSDILAKTHYVKAGSFDAVTRDRFMLMTDITFDVKVNWSSLLFGVLQDMVTPGSRQAKGFAIQICVLLKNVPGLVLGESREFPASRVLTEKTVHRYVTINEKVGMEETADAPRVKKTPAKKTVSTKRPVGDGEEAPIVKKKRTTKGKPVVIAQEAVPLQSGDHEIVDSAPEQPAAEAATDIQEPVVENEQTRIWSQLLRNNRQTRRCLLEDILMSIPVEVPLPSAGVEITKIVLGQTVYIPGVDEGDWYKASLPKIHPEEKRKEPLQLKDPAKGKPPQEHYSLICADIDLLVHLREQAEATRKIDDAQSDVLSRIHTIKRYILAALMQQEEAFRNLINTDRQDGRTLDDAQMLRFNEFRKFVLAQSVSDTADMLEVRKEIKSLDAKVTSLDEQVAATRNDLLEFRAQAPQTLNIVTDQLSELVAYTNRGGNDKKGEVSSSRPPPDDQN